MNPVVSILVPAYNAQAWIGDTLRSALGQTWPRKEIIVVDDGSTDHTREIADGFSIHGVTVVSQKNQGASIARNHAYSLARGDYIQWLDADDLLSPDKIALQMTAVEQHRGRSTLFSAGWGYFMHRPRKARFSPTALWCDLSRLEWLLRKWEGNLHMQPATWLVSRELTDAAGPWNSRISLDDDGEYFFRVVKASDGVRFIPNARVFYRISGQGSLSNIGRSNKKLNSQFLSMKTQISGLRELEDSTRVRAACVNYLQTWLTHFHPERPDIVSEAQQLAATLGGRLTTPELSWKYKWIKHLFGWSAAKRAQLHYNQYKTGLLRTWDYQMARLERVGH